MELLPAWMAFSLMVWRMSIVVPSEPSATVSMDLASPMFESAWAWPRALAVSLFEIVKPAESSDAELMRLPVERRSWRVLISSAVLLSDDSAIAACVFVLMRKDMAVPVEGGGWFWWAGASGLGPLIETTRGPFMPSRVPVLFFRSPACVGTPSFLQVPSRYDR